MDWYVDKAALFELRMHLNEGPYHLELDVKHDQQAINQIVVIDEIKVLNVLGYDVIKHETNVHDIFIKLAVLQKDYHLLSLYLRVLKVQFEQHLHQLGDQKLVWVASHVGEITQDVLKVC